MKEFIVTEEQAGMRIDRYLRHIAGPVGQGIIEKALRGGQIRVDSQKVKSGYRVAARQIVSIAPYFLEQAEKKPKQDSSEAKKTVIDASFAARQIDEMNLFRHRLAGVDKPSGLQYRGTGTLKHIDGFLVLVFRTAITSWCIALIKIPPACC